MAGLTGSTIATSYDQLLISDNVSGGNGASLVAIKDGDGGTTFCISLTDASTGKAVLAVDGSHASGTEIQIDNSAGDGDAFLSFQLSGTSKFTMGVDDGDSDIFKIGTTAIGTGTMFALDTNSKISLSNNDSSNTGNTIFGKSAWNNSSNNASDYNTIFGEGVMGTGAVAGATYNTGVGFDALKNLTAGDYNVAIGGLALDAAAHGESYNTAIGLAAMTSVAETASGTADYNVALGYNALEGGSLGSNSLIGNIAIGANAMDSTSTNAQTGTIAIGQNALTALTSGAGNVAIGYQALLGHTSGANNLAIGYNAMCDTDADDCPTSVENVFIGRYAGGGTWAGDDSNYNVGIGNSVMDAAMNGALGNVGIGYDALGSLTEGDYNTVVGNDAGDSITTGIGSVILGSGAGNGTEDVDNAVIIGRGAAQGVMTSGADGTIAIGYASLNALTSGTQNMAIGYNALSSATDGSRNMAIGYTAMVDNDSGALQDNVSIGHYSMSHASSGAGQAQTNVAVGNYTMTGQFVDATRYNTAIGHSALRSNAGGKENTCVGADAGYAVTTGNYNTILGRNAGNYGTLLVDGNDNVIIGAYSHTSATDTLRAVVLGYNVEGLQDYTTLGYGASEIRAAHGTATWATVSDKRFKKNIETSTAGLNFVNDLRPITYNWRSKGEIPEWSESYEEGSEEQYRNDGHNHGFVAQEVKATIDSHPEIKDGFSMWVEHEELGGQQEVGETALIPVLVKAIQELSQQVEDLKAKIK